MFNKITHYLRTGRLSNDLPQRTRRAEYKAVLFRAWELEFLAKAAQAQHNYECLEYSTEESMAICRLISKLERNAKSQAEKEREVKADG